MAKNSVKRVKKGVKHAIALSGVRSIVAFLPIIRRYERTYKMRDVMTYLSILMAHNGAMSVTGLCIGYYGDKSGYKYKYTQYALVRLRDNGLADNAGGKWSLTEKGMRELGLID